MAALCDLNSSLVDVWENRVYLAYHERTVVRSTYRAGSRVFKCAVTLLLWVPPATTNRIGARNRLSLALALTLPTFGKLQLHEWGLCGARIVGNR